MTSTLLGRRQFLGGAAALSTLALAGCASTSRPRVTAAPIDRVPPDVRLMYGPRPEEEFPLPAARIDIVPAAYWRQEIDNTTGEKAGTVVVDTANRYCYVVLPGGTRAMRYGVGIGRDGFSWSGRARIAYKRKWPTWTPPSEMIKRQPELEQYRNGMPPGLQNPLGARALYIFQNGKDTLYRLHGNPEENSIGRAVSSGCVRFLQQDIIDVYDRVPSGAAILVV